MPPTLPEESLRRENRLLHDEFIINQWHLAIRNPTHFPKAAFAIKLPCSSFRIVGIQKDGISRPEFYYLNRASHTKPADTLPLQFR